jgi:hypothetical protein
MKSFNWRVPVGLALVLLGIMAFLQSFHIITLRGDPWVLTFAVIFALIGAAFLYALAADRKNWWAAIPGMTLIGLGILMGLVLIPGIPGFIAPAIFMGSIAASFWVVYAMNRSSWWAIIPAGTLTSIALLIGLADSGDLGASVLFMGMAATFGLLGLIEVNGQHMSWPWIPAICLAVLSGIIGVTSSGVPSIVWAVVIILAGIFLVARPYIMNKKR